jgi:hypothetical protein
MFSQIIAGLLFVLFFAYLIVRFYESGAAQETRDEIYRMWKSAGVPGRAIGILFVAMMTLYGGSKGGPPVTGSLYRMLFWNGDQIYALLAADEAEADAREKINIATNSITSATNLAAQVTEYVSTNDIVTLSFDWPSPNRLPYHDRQNVLGRTVWVTPTNILGVLYEDHYVAFNESATTNPAVILIEYARKLDNGTVQRISSPTITNSYPDMVTVNLQSGSQTCYWFRCEVPSAFTNCCVRDWNGEALFGSPEGSGKGFDLLGTLLIDDGDNIWEGATTNLVMGTYTNQVKNGVILER